MGKTFASTLVALALVATANAGTARVFCQYLGGNLASPTAEQQASYGAFLSTNNVDFGFFYGPTSAGNFGLAAEGYTATIEYVSGTTKGGRVLVYKTSAWRVASHDSPENVGSSKYPNWCERYVLERLSNGEQFAVVLFTGTRFDKGSYLTYGTYLSNTPTLYPGAWVLVALPYNGALYTSSSYSSIVASNLSSGGYTRAPNVSGTGAVFSKNHATLSTSGASVPQSTLGFGGEPAALATVSYQRSLTVTFNDYDGSTIDTSTVLEGGNATPPADPTRTGWHFTGWSGSYQNVQTDLTLTAQYEINTYTVRFLDWNGTVLDTQTIAHGSDATPPADPTREGYRFTGWQGTYTGITAATDITATYVEATAVTHWVTFYDWDGTQLSRQEILEGEDATPPANPSREGYHFTGWSGNYTNVQQDETVTATFAINTYTVTFQDWDDTVLKTETVNHGSNATPPANPTRTGYTFREWGGSYSNVQAAATIVAQYDINTFIVTFQYTNGTVIAQQTVEYLGSATKPANPAPLDDTTVFYKWQGKYTSVTNDVNVLAIFVPKVIEVGTGAEFVEYLESDLMAMSAITLALTNDISLSGISHSGGQLVATIDGRGHTVSNIPSTFKMFSDLRGGTVRDICFKGFRSPGNANRTAIIASASYTGSTLSGVILENCHWTVPNGSYGTAGMIYNVSQNTLMTNCVMRNCSVLGSNAGGSHDGEPQIVGGFVAKASSLTMIDCHFIVDDTDSVAVGNGISVAGALIGKCGSGVTIRQCSNNARVAAKKLVYSSIGGAGGFVGISNSGSPTISESANFGIVESTVNYPAGGFIGDAGSESGTFSLTFNDNFNYGAVSSPIAAGGLIGRYRGVVSQLRNNGNSGAISSEAGCAGGLVGQILYNDANRTWRIRNAMQAGAVSTASGCAGLLVGGIEASDLAGLSMVVSNAVIAGSAATAGGKAGLLVGGRDTAAANELAFSLDEASRVLASNASLAHYYDKDNAPASLATAPTTIDNRALLENTAKAQLDRLARDNGWMRWIQGRSYPELSRFGTKFAPGLIISLW